MNTRQLDILRKFSECIKCFEQLDIKDIEDLKGMYGVLTEKEQKEVVHVINESMMGVDRERFILLSIFADNNKTSYLLECMADAAINAQFKLEDYYRIFVQFRYAVFTLPKTEQEALNRLYLHIYDRCVAELKPSWSYRNYECRNKNRIMIITDQLLGEQHSPTQIVINQYYYLKRAGYDVDILVVNESNIDMEGGLWGSKGRKMSCGVETEGFFHTSYFGYDVHFYNTFLDVKNLKKSMCGILDYVYDRNPLFVISVGGTSLVSDIASTFTTVIAKGLTKDIPITMTKYIIYHENMDMKNAYFNLNENIVPLNCDFNNVLEPPAEGDEDIISDISEIKGFKVAIVGNRLDDEVDDVFLEFLDEQTKAIDDIIYIVVGNCKRLKSILLHKISDKRVVFVGFVENLAGVMKACDVYLNPPRAGGGFSAHIALKNNIPIITLNDCDVYSWVGDRFVCNDLDDMGYTLKRYYEDMDFRNRKIKECGERCAEMELSEEEGINNTKRFCEDVKAYILADENEGNEPEQ